MERDYIGRNSTIRHSHEILASRLGLVYVESFDTKVRGHIVTITIERVQSSCDPSICFIRPCLVISMTPRRRANGTPGMGLECSTCYANNWISPILIQCDFKWAFLSGASTSLKNETDQKWVSSQHLDRGYWRATSFRLACVKPLDTKVLISVISQ